MQNTSSLRLFTAFLAFFFVTFSAAQNTESLAYADSISKEAYKLQQKGDYIQSIALVTKGLSIYERTIGKKSPNTPL